MNISSIVFLGCETPFEKFLRILVIVMFIVFVVVLVLTNNQEQILNAPRGVI